MFDPGSRREIGAAIDAPGTLAALLDLDIGQLAWLADARGLERGAGDTRLRHYTYAWLQRPAASPGSAPCTPSAGAGCGGASTRSAGERAGHTLW